MIRVPRKFSVEERTLAFLTVFYLIGLGISVATGTFDQLIVYVATEVLDLSTDPGDLSVVTAVVGFGTMLAGFLISFRLPPKELENLHQRGTPPASK